MTLIKYQNNIHKIFNFIAELTAGEVLKLVSVFEKRGTLRDLKISDFAIKRGTFSSKNPWKGGIFDIH